MESTDCVNTRALPFFGKDAGVFQSVKKVEVQEALPPVGVIGAEPLTLVPQHFSCKPA